SFRQDVSFDPRRHVLVVRAPLEQVGSHLQLARQQMQAINADIARHTPRFREQVAQMVRSRREEVSRQGDAFEQTMKTLGVTVQRKAGGVEPVNVRVKRNVEMLRQTPPKPKGPSEPSLAPEALTEILGLL